MTLSRIIIHRIFSRLSHRYSFAFRFIIKGWQQPLIIIHPLPTNARIMQILRIKCSDGKVSSSLSNQNGNNNHLRYLIIYIYIYQTLSTVYKRIKSLKIVRRLGTNPQRCLQRKKYLLISLLHRNRHIWLSAGQKTTTKESPRFVRVRPSFNY